MSSTSASDPRQGPADTAPASIQVAFGLVCAFVALSLLSLVLSFVYLDDLVSASLAGAGPEITEESARTSAMVGLGFTLVLTALWAFLGVLLRRGANWARIGLSALAGVGVLLGVFSLIGPEARVNTPLLVVGLLSLVVQAALLYFMWRKDASGYLLTRPAP
jgi:O-antigen/teichoic acid export membrane protein